VPAAIYSAQFFIGMTLFGGMALQLREIAKGKDPRPMDNAEFWADAAAQGGGIGIFGDLIGSFFNDRIDGVMAFVGGPMTGLAQDVAKTAKAKNASAAAIRMAKRYLPGSNLWYSRLAFERLIIDRASEMADPYYRMSWGRMERRAQEQGQDYWWEPGEDAPDRAPSAEGIVGDAQ
jgi:hypothetical protein